LLFHLGHDKRIEMIKNDKKLKQKEVLPIFTREDFLKALKKASKKSKKPLHEKETKRT